MRLDIGQPFVDFGDAVRVGRGFRLGQQRRAFDVGGQDDFQRRLLAGRRFLGDGADARAVADADIAVVRR